MTQTMTVKLDQLGEQQLMLQTLQNKLVEVEPGLFQGQQLLNRDLEEIRLLFQQVQKDLKKLLTVGGADTLDRELLNKYVDVFQNALEHTSEILQIQASNKQNQGGFNLFKKNNQKKATSNINSAKGYYNQALKWGELLLFQNANFRENNLNLQNASLQQIMGIAQTQLAAQQDLPQHMNATYSLMGHSSRDLVDEPARSSDDPTANKFQYMYPQRPSNPSNIRGGAEGNSASLTKTNPDNFSDYQLPQQPQKDITVEVDNQNIEHNVLHDTKSSLTDNYITQANEQEHTPTKNVFSPQNMQSSYSKPENVEGAFRESSLSFRRSPKQGELTPSRRTSNEDGQGPQPQIQQQGSNQGLNRIEEDQQVESPLDSDEMAQFIQGENTMNALWQYQIQKEMDQNRLDQLTTINEENSVNSSRMGKVAHTKSRKTNSVSDNSPGKNPAPQNQPNNPILAQNPLYGQNNGNGSLGGSQGVQGILSLGANSMNSLNKQLRVSFEDRQLDTTRREPLPAKGFNIGLRRGTSDDYGDIDKDQGGINNPVFRGQSLDSYQQQYGESKRHSHSGDMGDGKLKRSFSHDEGSSFQPVSPRNRPEDVNYQQSPSKINKLQSIFKFFHKKDSSFKDKDKKSKKKQQNNPFLDHTSSTSHYHSDNEHFNNHGLNIVKQSFHKDSHRTKTQHQQGTARSSGPQYNEDLDLIHHSSDKKHIYGPYNKDIVLMNNTNMIKSRSSQNLSSLENQFNSNLGIKQYKKNSSLDSEQRLIINESDRQGIKSALRNTSLQRVRSNNSVEWKDLQRGSSFGSQDNTFRQEFKELKKDSAAQRKDRFTRFQEQNQRSKSPEMFEAPIKLKLGKKNSRKDKQEEVNKAQNIQEQRNSSQEDNQFFDVSTGRINFNSNQNDSKTLFDSKRQTSNTSETYGLEFVSANQTPTQSSIQGHEKEQKQGNKFFKRFSNSSFGYLEQTPPGSITNIGFDQQQKQGEQPQRSLSGSLGQGTDPNVQTPPGSVQNTRKFKSNRDTPTKPTQRFPSPPPRFNASFQRSSSIENQFQTPISSQNDIQLDSQTEGSNFQQGKIFSMLNLRDLNQKEGKSFFGKTSQLQQSISLTPKEQQQLEASKGDYFEKTTRKTQGVPLSPKYQPVNKDQQRKRQQQRVQLSGQSSSEGEQAYNQQDHDNSEGGKNSKHLSSNTSNSHPSRPESKLEMLEKQMQQNPLLQEKLQSNDSKKLGLPPPPRPHSSNRPNSETGSRTTTDLPSNLTRLNDMFDQQQEQVKNKLGGSNPLYSSSPKKSNKREKETAQDELSWILQSDGKNQKFVSSQELKDGLKTPNESGGSKEAKEKLSPIQNKDIQAGEKQKQEQQNKDKKNQDKQNKDKQSSSRALDKVKVRGRNKNGEFVEYKPNERKEKLLSQLYDKVGPIEDIRDGGYVGSPFREKHQRQNQRGDFEVPMNLSPSKQHLHTQPQKDPFAEGPSPKNNMELKLSKRDFMRSPRNSNLTDYEQSLQSPFKQGSLKDDGKQSATHKQRQIEQSPFAAGRPTETSSPQRQGIQGITNSPKSPRRSPLYMFNNEPSPKSSSKFFKKTPSSQQKKSPNRKLQLSDTPKQAQVSNQVQNFDNSSLKFNNQPQGKDGQKEKDLGGKNSYENRSFMEYMQSPAFKTSSHNLKERLPSGQKMSDQGFDPQQTILSSGKDPAIEEISQNLKIAPIRTRTPTDKRVSDDLRKSSTPKKSGTPNKTSTPRRSSTAHKSSTPHKSTTPRKSEGTGKMKPTKDFGPASSQGLSQGGLQDYSYGQVSGQGPIRRSSGGDTDFNQKPQSASKSSSRPKFVLSEPLPFEDRLFKREKERSLTQVYKDKKQQEQLSKQNLSKGSTDLQNSLDNSQQITARGSYGRKVPPKNLQKLQKGQSSSLQNNKIQKQRSQRRSSSRQGSVKKVEENGEIVVDLSSKFPKNNWYRQDSGSFKNGKAMHQNKHLQMYLTHQQQAAEEYSRSQFNSKVQTSPTGSISQEIDPSKGGVKIIQEDKPRTPPPFTIKEKQLDDGEDTLTSTAKKRNQQKQNLRKDGTISTLKSNQSQSEKQKQKLQKTQSSVRNLSEEFDDESDRLISSSRQKIRQLRSQERSSEKQEKQQSASLKSAPIMQQENEANQNPREASLGLGNYNEASLRLPSAQTETKQDTKRDSKDRKQTVDTIKEEEESVKNEPTPKKSPRSPRGPRLFETLDSSQGIPSMNYVQHLAFLREQKKKEAEEAKEKASFAMKMKQKSDQYRQLHSGELSESDTTKPVQAAQTKSPRQSPRLTSQDSKGTEKSEPALHPPRPPPKDPTTEKHNKKPQTRDVGLQQSIHDTHSDNIDTSLPHGSHHGEGEHHDSYGNGSLSLGGRRTPNPNMNKSESIGFSFPKGDSLHGPSQAQSLGLKPQGELQNTQLQDTPALKAPSKGGKKKKGPVEGMVNLARDSMNSPRNTIRKGAELVSAILIGDKAVNHLRRQRTVSTDTSDGQKKNVHFNLAQDGTNTDSDEFGRTDSLACPVCHQGYNVKDRVPKLVCARKGHSVCSQCAKREILEAGNPVCPVCGVPIVHRGKFQTDHAILERVNTATEFFNQDQVLPAFKVEQRKKDALKKIQQRQGTQQLLQNHQLEIQQQQQQARLNQQQRAPSPLQNGHQNGLRKGKRFPSIWSQGSTKSGMEDPEIPIANSKLRALQQQAQLNPALSPLNMGGNSNFNPWNNPPSPQQRWSNPHSPQQHWSNPQSPQQHWSNPQSPQQHWSNPHSPQQHWSNPHSTQQSPRQLQPVQQREVAPSPHQKQMQVDVDKYLNQLRGAVNPSEILEALRNLKDGLVLKDPNYSRYFVRQGGIGVLLEENLLLSKEDDIQGDVLQCLALLGDGDKYIRQQIVQQISDLKLRELLTSVQYDITQLLRNLDFVLFLARPYDARANYANQEFCDTISRETFREIRRMTMEQVTDTQKKLMQIILLLVPASVTFQREMLSQQTLGNSTVLLEKESGDIRLINTLVQKTVDPQQFKYQASFMYALQGLAASSQDLKYKIATYKNMQAILVAAYQNRSSHAQAQAVSLLLTLLTDNPEAQNNFVLQRGFNQLCSICIQARGPQQESMNSLLAKVVRIFRKNNAALNQITSVGLQRYLK